ncbi:FtsK/SpoIIIE domain-containing protein [Streptomyces sp. NRRL F-5630]|uniref:FtsK/SpoIIIE domain-containing protein n=1 Tax=Streptomyces sp. NRRL F-5630 TaxID=1463864 RepID=UPI003D749022
MQVAVTVVDPQLGRTADVLLVADDETDAAEVVAALARHTDSPPDAAAFVDGQPLRLPLRDGCVVSLGGPGGCADGEPTGLVEVRVTGGPDAGGVHRLGAGRYVLGSGPHARPRIADPGLPPLALTLRIAPDGTCAYEAAADGLRVDGAPAPQTGTWPYGSQLSLAETLLAYDRYLPPDAALTPTEDGTALAFNRPPRLRPPAPAHRFRLPSPVPPHEPRPLPWLMAAAPLLCALVSVALFGRWYYLALAALSPLLLFATHYLDKRQGRTSHAARLKKYAADKARIEAAAQDALAAERRTRIRDSPDPATVLCLATGPRARLWERRRTDPDHLLLRFGTGTLPSTVVLDDPAADEHERATPHPLTDVPITLPLAALGVLGIAGPPARSLARWSVAQLVALHSPLDVRVLVLTEPAARPDWHWLRHLPHARPSASAGPHTLLGTDPETVIARVKELTRLLDTRREAAKERNASAQRLDPDLVVVWDGARRLREYPGAVRLLSEGPSVGIHSLCLDADEAGLPAECQATVVPDPCHPHRLRVRRTGSPTVDSVRPDLVRTAWNERLSRALAPLRDPGPGTPDAALPTTSRLLPLLALDPPTSSAVRARWLTHAPTTTAVIGESYEGPFAVDLCRDGPHGLVAGTTGSGKSELLQTLVASLAATNTPEHLTFVLVDYKGGAAFRDCDHLPHTVGTVTDLDTHLTERALVSLRAELHRRERILAAAGAKDIEEYAAEAPGASTEPATGGVTDVAGTPGLPGTGGTTDDVAGATGPPGAGGTTDMASAIGLPDAEGAPGPPGARRLQRRPPLPRLLLVIDEFASLARELPDFVSGLVDIAQRGRSLGIHLLLATQRPAGVVSPEIRANTTLRIALRVTDPSESSDVIDSPEAAHLAKTTPGRALARLGHASLTPFQTARVAGGVSRATTAPRTVWTHPLTWADLGRPTPVPPPPKTLDDEGPTDLKALVTAIREATTALAIPPPHAPWLPALPDHVSLGALTTADTPPGSAPYGIEDHPATQSRRHLTLTLDTFTHLLVAGSPRSGRSQILRTLAGSLARAHSCADVHLYGIDCGDGALAALASLPQCGAVVARHETDRATRLLARLTEELARRQSLFTRLGHAGITEQRATAPPAERLPHLLVLLDRWEGWLPTLGSHDHGELTEQLQALLREGASAGLHLVLTGDRQLLLGRLASLTEEKYALRLADRADYSLLGIPPRSLPAHIPPGRAFRAESGTETHFALLDAPPEGRAQTGALTALGTAATARDQAVPASRRPFRLDALPSRIDFAEAWKLRPRDRGPLWALAGVGGDTLTALGPDLGTAPPAFVVAGPARSGRSTALCSLARSLLAHGTRLLLVTPRPSPLRDLAPQAQALFTGPGLKAADLEAALDLAEGPTAVLVDDAEALTDCDASPVLTRLLREGSALGRALVLAGDEDEICAGFSGWQPEARTARRGLLLSPRSPAAGDLAGLRLTRTETGGPVIPGRGLLHLGDGEAVRVTVPH